MGESSDHSNSQKRWLHTLEKYTTTETAITQLKFDHIQ